MRTNSNIQKSIQLTLLFAGIFYCLLQLFISWSKPILDEYAFRQTQTAISVYWMLKGGAWVAYPTPVLGAPWSIPFEFPLYQWFVALLAKNASSITLDQAGRIVSEIFFLCCLWPLWRIASHHKASRAVFTICTTVLLFSPLYVFWSRSFMMESAALFFSLWFVAALTDFMKTANTFGFFEMAITATLAALIKITTFVGFSFAGALIVFAIILNNPKSLKDIESIVKYALVLISVVISVICLWLWVHFSDILKSENVIGQFYTSKSLTSWNFGTLNQRHSIKLLKVIVDRAPNEALGIGLIFPFLLVYGYLKSSFKDRVIIAGLVFLYLLPFFVFTNVHIVHHYYQYANSIFLVLASGYLIYVVNQQKPILGTVVLGAFISIQILGFYRYFFADMTYQGRALQTSLATYVKRNTASDQVIVGFGLAWSSEVPYYSNRRALLIPDSLSSTILTNINARLPQYIGGNKIGAVVDCPNSYSLSASESIAYKKLLTLLTQGMKPHTVAYCTVYN